MNTVYCSGEGCEILKMFWLPKLLPKKIEKHHSFADIVLLKKIYSLSKIVKPEVLRPSFASIAKNEPRVPLNELWLEVKFKLRLRK